MNDQRHQGVPPDYSLTSYSRTAHLARYLLVLLCLLAVCLPVRSDQTNKRSPSTSAPSQVSSPEKTNNTATLNDRPGLDNGRSETFDCVTPPQSESAFDGESSVERLFQTTTQKSPAFSCLSSVQPIYNGWSRNEALLIDVRRSDEFQKYQIPGSINLEPFSIKSKSFLKDKRIVLLNEGRYLSQLEALCVRLKAKGFRDVAVMAGGLHAWYQARYPVIGDRLELSKLNQISPAELIASLHERDWKFIELDQSLSSLAELLPPSAILEYQANKREFISAINRANKRFAHPDLNGFLVVNEQGDNYRKIERLLQLTDAKNIFYLSGGISAFKRYLHTHSSLMSRLARGFKEPHRCSG
jgi:rhodanese-related sulfurtransferase